MNLMMLKKLMCSVILILFCGCIGAVVGEISVSEKATVDNKVYSNNIMEYSTIDDLLDDADVVLRGKINHIAQCNEYDEFDVSIVDKFKGDVGSKLNIRNYYYEYTYTYDEKEMVGKTNTSYKEGEEYIFVLQHINNVYEDKYVILSDSFIPVDSNLQSTVLSSKIENISNVVEYVKKHIYKSDAGKGNELGITYTKSKKLDVIANSSKYIVEVKIGQILRSTDVVDVYKCDVLENLKGKVNSTKEHQIIIPFFKGDVQEGKNYIVLLNSDTDDTYIYALASKSHSVLELNKKEVICDLVKKIRDKSKA